MSDDDPEIIPPKKGGVPTVREGRSNLPAERNDITPRPTGGFVGSVVTGFQAKHKGRALTEIAKSIRAEADVNRAATERAEARGDHIRALSKLDDIANILDDDQAARDHTRAESSFERDERRKDWDSEKDVREAQRAQRVAEAKRAAMRAQHGLEAEQEFKDKKFDLGRMRADARHLEATVQRDELKAALDEHGGNAAPESPIDTLMALRDEALARGDHDGAEKLRRAILALAGDED